MAFKKVPEPSYDAGYDLLDQVPPALIGAVLAVVLVVLAAGTFWFLRRHYSELRSNPSDLPPHL